MSFDFDLFLSALFSSEFAAGAGISLVLAVLAQLLAVLLGFLLALVRMSNHPMVRYLSGAYVWFFRAIPTLIILLVIWNALPQVITPLRGEWFTPFIAALIGLSLTEAAYMAEILRSALNSVDSGQALAGRALGMTPAQVMLKVTLPQVIRVALPPTGNEFIGMVKFTSLASVISLTELLATAEARIAQTFRYAEMYSAAVIYYLVIVSILMFVQRHVEIKYRWSRKLPARALRVKVAQ